jgi:signal peptidase I
MHEIYFRTARELNEASQNKQDLLRLKVTSRSMDPILRIGDHVLVQSTSPSLIRCGDLIVTRREDGYLTHRLLTVDERGWHTKGDRNQMADAPVDASIIVGLVIAIERQGKLRNIRLRPQCWITRVQRWLGWQEIKCNSQLEGRTARVISRVLSLFFHY